MEEILKQLSLSHEAIKLYNECLGKSFLTYNELYSFVPNLSPDNFKNIINELANAQLLVQITPQKPEILTHYTAIPPFGPILNLHSNITNISSIQGLVVNSLYQLFKNDTLELDSTFNQFQEIEKELSDEIISQKQKIEEMVKFKDGHKILSNLKEELSRIKQFISDLYENVRSITQTQFSNLITILKSTKEKIIVGIKGLEQKKDFEKVYEVIEDSFSTDFQSMVQEFVSTIGVLIDLEFKKIQEPLSQILEDFINKNVIESMNNLIDDTTQFQENLINNLNARMNKIQDIIKNNKDNLLNNWNSLEKLILDNLNEIFQNSISQVSELGKSIEGLRQGYFDSISSSEKTKIDNIWLINSKPKLLEEIVNIIINSKQEIMFIVPKMENYLKIEQFQNIPSGLRIKIASSNSPEDNIVKSLKKIPNFEFRTLHNENLIALKGDNDHIVINVENPDSKGVLDDSIGLGSNFKHIIDILTPILDTSWAVAKPEEIKKPEVIEPERVTEPKEIAEIKTSQISFVSKFHPKEGDGIGMKLDDAFNSLIQKLNNLKGDKFSQELQKIADLILEKIGFCVTLHNIGTWVSIYKTKYNLLDEDDKVKIFEAIESWKQKLY